jgi:Spy/CpxP family protein refolding chaperone
MTPRDSRRLLAAVLVLLVSSVASAQPFQWWRMDSVRLELELTADQSAQIDAIFQKAIADLRTQKDELDGEETRLSSMIASMAEEAQVVRQIDRVESVRGAANKTRTLMLLHMRQVLTPDQRTKLNEIHARWEEEQRARDRERLPADRADGPRRRPN